MGMRLAFGVVADGAYWHYATPCADGWKYYPAHELPEVADLLDKAELTDDDWQRIHAAIAARAQPTAEA